MDHKVLETDRHRYVVVSSLAEGGMGTVYLGRRVSAGAAGNRGDSQAADVVLKQLNPEHTDDPKLIEMFIREARLSASLDHPNIVRALDLVNVGQDYFIVMEYVRGGDLRSLLRRAKRRQARLSIDSALFIITEVLAALSYAHSKRTRDGRPMGLIHRDVSPSNILLAADGEVKLTDFGIAKLPTQGSVVFKVKGKIGYMAPEQARGEPTDQRADLFAAGVVLYEMLADERLFLGNAFASPAVIFAQPIRAPSRKRAEVSPELDEIVLRSLSLDPDERFSSAQEMRAAILRAAERARRTLDTHELAADLRNACGEDSASWLSLDVPANATLDGRDGTGVILTEQDDEMESERYSGSRAALLPSKELTSIVRLADPAADAEAELVATRIARDPLSRSSQLVTDDSRLAFTGTDIAVPTPTPLARPRARQGSEPQRPPIDASEFEREDSAVRTRVQNADALINRATAPVADPAPAAGSSNPDARRRSIEPAVRAVFEPPVPRVSPPPPSEHDLSRVMSVPEPTRITLPGAVTGQTAASLGPPAYAPAAHTQGPPALAPGPHSAGPQPTVVHPAPTPPAAPAPAPLPPVVSSRMNTGRGEGSTSAPHALGPVSLAGLQRSLDGRPLTRVLVGIALVLVLIALGVGLGVLISGGDPEDPALSEDPSREIPPREPPAR